MTRKNILKLCDKLDAASEKATPRPWRIIPLNIDDHAYALLAANHAQDLTKLVRRLVEFALVFKSYSAVDGCKCERCRILREIEVDYLSLRASRPKAQRLEGGEEREKVPSDLKPTTKQERERWKKIYDHPKEDTE